MNPDAAALHAHAADAVGAGIVLGLFAVFVLLLLIPFLFYLASLQRAANKIPDSRRPFPGGLVWMGLIPYFGEGWLAIAQVAISNSIRAEFSAAGQTDEKGGFGFSIALAVCFVVRIVLTLFGVLSSMAGANGVAAFFYILSFVVILLHLVLWVVYWICVASASSRLPLLSAPAGIPPPAPPVFTQPFVVASAVPVVPVPSAPAAAEPSKTERPEGSDRPASDA